MKPKTITPARARRLLPKRPTDGHKYTFGHLFVWAGSMSYRGAPLLACASAYHAGCGLVTLACPHALIPAITSQLPEVVYLPLDIAQQDAFYPNVVTTIIQSFAEKQPHAAVVGPGWEMPGVTPRLLKEFLQKSSVPTVVDATALGLLATFERHELRDILFAHGQIVLTPHEGEFSRLVGMGVSAVREDRLAVAQEFARDNRCILVLKGPNTIVTDGKTCYQNTTGKVNLATAGTGDVLAGIIGALLAQGMSLIDAASLGVFIHGKAGDLWYAEFGDRGMLASAIPTLVPKVYRSLLFP